MLASNRHIDSVSVLDGREYRREYRRAALFQDAVRVMARTCRDCGKRIEIGEIAGWTFGVRGVAFCQMCYSDMPEDEATAVLVEMVQAGSVSVEVTA